MNTTALVPAGVDLPAFPGGYPSDRNPAAVYLARLAPGSRRTMRAALDAAAQALTAGQCDALAMPWHQLLYQHTAALRANVASRYAPATANKILAAVKGALREAWHLGLMDAEAYHQAAAVPCVRGETLPRGRALLSGEVRALFETCAHDDTASGPRDAAILSVLYGAGLRRSEAVKLDMADFDADTGALVVRSGKGAKDRVVYLANGAGRAMVAWIRTRGTEPGPLFLPVNKSGRIAVRRLTDQAILDILKRRAGQARVRDFSPHDLRRTMISDLLDAGADIAAVQRLAGHSNVQTTMRYDRRGEVAKQKAAALLHVPYMGE